jgi:hypothetical protein
MLNEDYKEMLQCLLEEDVRFLLVGGNRPGLAVLTSGLVPTGSAQFRSALEADIRS